MPFLALFHHSNPEHSISVFFPSSPATVIQFLPSLKRDSCVYGTRHTAQVTNRVEVWRLIYGADDRNKISLFTPSGMQNETITTSSKFTTREEKRGHEKKRNGDCVVKVIKYELWPGGGGGVGGGGGAGDGGGGDESPRRRMGGGNMKNGMIQRGW